jgi:hypothetical protein
VDGFVHLEGQLGGGDLIEAGADRQETPAAGETLGLHAALGSRVELRGDQLARALGAQSGERGMEEKR